MRTQPLPWESLPAPIYLARDTIRRKGWVKAGGWFLVVALLAGGLATRWKIALVFGVLYALALVMEKSAAVTQRGLEVFYQMQITTNYELWAWSDLYALTHEPDPKNGKQTVVYFTKGDRTRHFIFAKDEAEDILRLAKTQNPEIRIYDGRETRNKMQNPKRKK